MNTRARLGGWLGLLAGLLLALAPRAEAVLATGGTVTNYIDAGGTNWTAHVFTNSGTFTVMAGGGNSLAACGGCQDESQAGIASGL